MANRRPIFKTANIREGKALAAYKGWAADWRRMCYLFEHLTADTGVTLEWFPDGSVQIHGHLYNGDGIGGGSSYPKIFEPKFSGGAITEIGEGAFVFGREEIAEVDTSAVIGEDEGTVYLHVDHETKTGTLTLDHAANTDTSTCVTLYKFQNGAITVDYRGMPQIQVYE